eukprot:scaffold316498_cov17-Tisochrysis_lutea.AAC.1
MPHLVPCAHVGAELDELLDCLEPVVVRGDVERCRALRADGGGRRVCAKRARQRPRRRSRLRVVRRTCPSTSRTLAPSWMSCSITSAFPCRAAMCSAVHPSCDLRTE